RTGRERALELEHAEPVRLAAEVGREQAVRLGPVRGELAGRGRPDADPVPEVDLRARGDADQRRDRGVCMSAAEEGCLERAVGAVEGAVVPVEAAARLG